MKKKFIAALCLVFLVNVSFSQGGQFIKGRNMPTSNASPQNSNVSLKKPEGFLVRDLKNTTLSPIFQTHSAMSLEKLSNPVKVLESNREGYITRFEAKNIPLSRTKSKADAWAEKLPVLLGLVPSSEVHFAIHSETIDELGIHHLKYNQMCKGIKIYATEYFVHLYPNESIMAHGNIQVPDRIIEPKIEMQQALSSFENKISQIDSENNNKDVPSFLRTGVKSQELVYWFDDVKKVWHLAFNLIIQTKPTDRYEALVDAETGEVLKSFQNLCKFHKNCSAQHRHEEMAPPTGPETTNATDLFGTNRNLNVWREGSTVYFIDASRPMFKANQFKLDDPIGVVWTLDAFNTSPAKSNFRYDHVKSTNNTWGRNAVSAHHNGGLAYLYFLNVHGRNSINGQGGTIISLVNVAEENGRSMDNAFWNGEAMFYGNGDQAFTSLAKALDVAGHEMSHGVIQSTANLVYENEPGAINESFADIFGAMIDRDDWRMGEDVVNTSIFRSGALRDLSNPHNGTSQGGNGWQPRNVSEQFRGSADNGGVHINSGITNYAFYLFVQELAKAGNEESAKKIAEKIYYRALAQYLSRSSQFKDLRNAIEQSCKDLHASNASILTAAQKAFDAVGIGGTSGGGGGGGGSTSYQNDLPVNPGPEFIVATDQSYVGVFLVQLSNSAITQISNQTILSKPSITDNGEEIYFVNDDHELIGMFFNRTTGRFNEVVLDNSVEYRNACISKDGRFLAALYNFEENKIHIFDFTKDEWNHNFILTNPTYSDGVSTSNVRYADFMDFEHGGEYLMYDALSRFTSSTGTSYQYWDISFIRVFNRAANTWGDRKIVKLFSKLPQNASIGNPVFSKNSPYIICFDYRTEDVSSVNYQIVGMNIETNSVQLLVDNLDDFSYPSYAVKDNFVIYDLEKAGNTSDILRVPLQANKIMPSGIPQRFFNEGRWASWIAFGSRKLIATEDLKTIHEIVVSPNPVIDDLQINIKSDELQSVRISCRNLQGVLLVSDKWNLQQGENQKRLDLNQLLPGYYLLSIENQTGRYSVPIIKR